MTYLIPRLYDPSEGVIRIDGHDLRDVTLDSLSSAIGMVTQETYLFHDTIRTNLTYAKPTPPRPRSKPRRGRPTSTSSSWTCPRATTRSSASAATA
jgi:ABC-type methionine transport system ATPase subunit